MRLTFLSAILVFLFSTGNGAIEWNFTFPIGTGPTAELQVGTPPVTVRVYAYLDPIYSFMTDLEIPDASVHGKYSPFQSSSFVQTDVLIDWTGQPAGLNGEQKTSKPFAVRNDSLYAAIAPFGTLGFGHSPADGQALSFVEGLLADYADQVVSVSYDNIPAAADHAGEVGLLLRFGNRQAARCSAEWLELEEANR
ncbi:hypothetical protein M3Y99_00641300 [Aphelenchoides fujianensis]|nr:hypothetical protein M3Y99_00641300 [Aphelenchoides fujianensis]